MASLNWHSHGFNLAICRWKHGVCHLSFCHKILVRRSPMNRVCETEMLDGYFDGFDPDSPEPSGNRSASYRHGFWNGRDDRKGRPRDSAANLRVQAELAADSRSEERRVGKECR